MTVGGIQDLQLFGCGGTPISSVSDSLSDRTANWFRDAKNELAPVGCLKWALLAFGLGAGRKSCMLTPDKLKLTAKG
jgi:hypothetical protein